MKNNIVQDSAEALEILEKFEKLDYAIHFQCLPDGRVPAESFDYHIHPFWELKFTLQPPVLCIHAPDSVHCATMPDLVIAADCRKFQLFDWVMETASGTPRQNWIPELLDMLDHFKDDRELLPLARNISSAVIRNCRILLKNFPAGAASYCDSRGLADRALEYMRNRYFHQDLSVNDIARFCGVSPQCLNQAMHRKTGFSIRKNLIRIRLEEAFRLLQSSNYPVKTAAALTGWSSAFYFSNCFRNHYGFPPGRIREKSGQNPKNRLALK